jgi:hypothetical protein
MVESMCFMARMDPNAAVQHRKDKEREEAYESAITKACGAGDIR